MSCTWRRLYCDHVIVRNGHGSTEEVVSQHVLEKEEAKGRGEEVLRPQIFIKFN